MSTDPRGSDEDAASPTIAEALDLFLAEQAVRLSPRTFSHYRSIVQLFEIYLNSYAPGYLSEADEALYSRLNDASGDESREFCEIFGPEHILHNIGMFISYFMVRKVAPGKELLQASGTVTKRLALWLADNGCVSVAKAQAFAENGTAAAREALTRRHPYRFD